MLPISASQVLTVYEAGKRRKRAAEAAAGDDPFDDGGAL